MIDEGVGTEQIHLLAIVEQQNDRLTRRWQQLQDASDFQHRRDARPIEKGRPPLTATAAADEHGDREDQPGEQQ